MFEVEKLFTKIEFIDEFLENTKVCGYGIRAIRLLKNISEDVHFPSVSSTLLSIPLIHLLIARTTHTQSIRLFLSLLSCFSMTCAMV